MPRRAEELDDRIGRQRDGRVLPFGSTPRDLARERRDLALHVADTRLARVAANHQADRFIGEGDGLRRQSVVRDLLRDEVLLRDLELLLLGIARQLEHFHPVAQRRRNRVEHVRRRHKQHFRQIERHVEIMIAERVVLLRIEHLEQRRARDRRGSLSRACRSRRG